MTGDSVTVRIGGGVLSFVYSDDLAPLLDAGAARVQRASHVEPYDGSQAIVLPPCSCVPYHANAADCPAHGVDAPRYDLGSWWIADMVDGPVLGPFPLRAQALDAERAWLAEHRGL